MVRRPFSYPNLLKNILFQIFSVFIVCKRISKNYSRAIFLEMLFFINVHPSLYLWTHDIRIWNGILINCKRPLINS